VTGAALLPSFADRPVCPPLRTSCCAAANRRLGPISWPVCGMRASRIKP